MNEKLKYGLIVGISLGLLATGIILLARKRKKQPKQKHKFSFLPTGKEKVSLVNETDKGTLIFSPTDPHQLKEINEGIAFMNIDTTNKTAEVLATTSGEVATINYQTRKFI